MNLWIKHELQNNLMLEEILFNFGKIDGLEQKNNTEEINQQMN